MYLRHTSLQNAVHLIHFYFLTKCAVRLVLFFHFSQNVAVFPIIIYIVSLIFFFQASESSGLAAMQSHAMLHFGAAAGHSPVHNNLNVSAVLLPALSSLVPFAPDIPSKFLPFFCLAYTVNLGLLPLYGNFMVTSYSIYSVFSRKFSRIFRLLQTKIASVNCNKKATHGISSACGSLLYRSSRLCLIF